MLSHAVRAAWAAAELVVMVLEPWLGPRREARWQADIERVNQARADYLRDHAFD